MAATLTAINASSAVADPHAAAAAAAAADDDDDDDEDDVNDDHAGNMAIVPGAAWGGSIVW